jgi:hypothetical protein
VNYWHIQAYCCCYLLAYQISGMELEYDPVSEGAGADDALAEAFAPVFS